MTRALHSSILLFISSCTLLAQVDLPPSSEFKYLKGKDAADIAADWMNPGYDDTFWETGDAPFWYGDGNGGTELVDMQNNYSSLYLRTTFTADNVAALTKIAISCDFDDGCIVWINGQEVWLNNVPANRAHDQFAPANHESGNFETIIRDIPFVPLLDGENILAVQAFNMSLSSTDFHMNISLEAEKYRPPYRGDSKLSFSHASSIYSGPFTLELSTSDTAAHIIYTLDGSNPQYADDPFVGGHTVSVLIDPDSIHQRPSTPGILVRAAVTKGDSLPSTPVNRTFIMIDSVHQQGYPGGEWPSQAVNEQVIDLDVSKKVAEDPRYSEMISEALLDIPSISLVTDMPHLFSPQNGIYVNAYSRGDAWERACTMDLINSQDSGFHVPAGLRIRGGHSRKATFPKHSFRLYFRKEYGMAKLDYPLFGDEGVDQFDQIDLRTSQNYSWTAHSNSHNTLVREVFSRDTQGDMGMPYTRSRYYHLYLNGMYWGLFQSQERAEEQYAADYLGDSKTDYDIIKNNSIPWPPVIEVASGKIDQWQEVFSMCQRGFEDNAAYFKLAGRGKNGRSEAGSKVLVDVDNLIDYMIIIFYTGNFDAPTTAFAQNTAPNNFVAIHNRKDPGSGFVFFCHDAEHSMMVEATGPGKGLSENRVSIPGMSLAGLPHIQDNYGAFDRFHPGWLHDKLSVNPEYRMRFADRVAPYFAPGGFLSPDLGLERFNARVEQIDKAIVAESLRWGDFKNSTPRTRDDDWLPEIQIIRDEFFPKRGDIVLQQLRDAGLFPHTEAPLFKENAIEIQGTRFQFSSTAHIEISNPNDGGTIYYTLDGEDPRMVGGDKSPEAFSGTASIHLDLDGPAIITARIHTDGEWSPKKILHAMGSHNDFSKLKLTEINYHPLPMNYGEDTLSGKALEFLEFKNTGTNAINLGGLVLDSAIYYEFPDNTLLAPGQFWVVASKPNSFYKKYGMEASGNYENFLSNGGEQILLRSADGNHLISMVYGDDPPWPNEADGGGYSLSSLEFNPAGDPAEAAYWVSSVIEGGTPFADNEISMASLDARQDSFSGRFNVYPNPASSFLRIEDIDHTGLSYRVRLLSLTGELVLTESMGAESLYLDLESLALNAGLYLLEISGPHTRYYHKIIITD